METQPEDSPLQAAYANALATIGSVSVPATVIELARYSIEGNRPTLEGMQLEFGLLRDFTRVTYLDPEVFLRPRTTP